MFVNALVLLIIITCISALIDKMAEDSIPHTLPLSDGAPVTRPDEMRTSSFKRHKSSLKGRQDIQLHGKSDTRKRHEIVIAVVQANLDQIEEIVRDISDPDSINFGAVRTKDEIISLTNHRESCDIITRYLKAIWRSNVSEVAIKESDFGEFIKGKVCRFITY